MALNKEIWIDSIVGNLFADDSFLARAVNHSAFVENKTVHVPNAGSAPTVTKNRSTFPATAGARTDYDLSYSLGEFSTAPFYITNVEETELSYDKRESIVSACREALKNAVATDILKSWLPASGFAKVATTGPNVAAHLASQTGNRKAVTLTDILAVKKEMDKANVPQDGRCLLLDYEMYAELLAALTTSQANAFLASADAAKGIVGRIYGFDVYECAEVLRAVAAGTSLQTTPAATDQAAGLAWHPSCVSVAQGEAQLFEREKDPLYYGDVVSALVRAGGSYIRNDKSGVVLLVQATPA